MPALRACNWRYTNFTMAEKCKLCYWRPSACARAGEFRRLSAVGRSFCSASHSVLMFAQFFVLGAISVTLNTSADLVVTMVALVTFDSHVSRLRAFTRDSDKLNDAFQKLEAGDEGAAIQDAVQYSVRMLEREPEKNRRVLLLISETRDHGSNFSKIEDVVAEVGNSNTVVYTLAFSPSWSQVLDTERGSNRDEGRTSGDLLAPLVMVAQAMRRNTARAIAGMTGGEYEMFSSLKSFERRMTEFTNHLHSRYLLSFEPQGPHPGLHEIRVRLKQPGRRTILARSSYWATGSAR